MTGHRVGDDSVCVVGGWDACEDLERGEVEGDHDSGLSVVGEALPGGHGDRRSVGPAGNALDLADEPPARAVHDRQSVSMSHVDPVRRPIEDHVIPPVRSAEGGGLHEVIGRRGGLRLCPANPQAHHDQARHAKASAQCRHQVMSKYCRPVRPALETGE